MVDAKLIIDRILKQKTLVFSSVAISCAISMLLFPHITKTYKVQATLAVQPQYFQTPFVRDFAPETNDGELRSQREGLVRRALNHEFLLEIGKRHHLFGDLRDDEITTYELDLLSQRFEIIPAGPSSFLFNFMSNDAHDGYAVIQETIAHLRNRLNEERRASLLRLHDALQDQLEVLSFGRPVDGNTPSTILASRPDLVRVEIERVKAQIAVIERTYSAKHPKVRELQKRLISLQGWLTQPTSETANAPARAGVFSGANVDDAAKDLFQDLLRKYRYLEVAIYLDTQSQDTYLAVLQEPFVPKVPLWPKRPLVLIWGVLVGFLIGAGLAMVSEVLQDRLVRVRKLEAT